MRFRGFVCCALVACSSAIALAQEFEREQDLSDKEGKPAPKLEGTGWMNTPEGEPLKLASLKGKVVVIDFWGTW